ncbi:lipoprotein, putative [Roseobacter sp. SK209-2-6]|uniref:hypothetical protein n=1 Tax=Roseobacter sp. SK209-2-6 TaxID=388739 RepID=UPI0000F3F2DC|nr:hypothetical protein [Roseobacter sp. SK209-2-6]EBA16526.1 lipoprotein, putative [Roseobacter sp. SK209-2-6]
MRRLVTLLAICILPLAACTLDQEDELRAQLDPWVTLGDTFYFSSSSTCTAAIFHAQSARVSSLLEPARSVNTGLQMVAEKRPVVFKVGGKSPNAVVEDIMSKDLPNGLGVLNSGLAGVNCMTDREKSIYYRAIMNPKAQLAFLPKENAVMVVDPGAMAVIFVRGNA